MPADYRKYTCPACNGKGCQLCQGKGTVMATSQQIQRAKSMLQQAVKQRQQIKQIAPEAKPAIPSTIENKPSLAGLITILVLLILGGSAGASYVYFKSLKPFFASLATLIIGGITKLIWNSSIMKSKLVDDFISGLENNNA